MSPLTFLSLSLSLTFLTTQGYMARWNQPLLWNGAFYNETTLCNANCYCSPVAPKTAYHTAIALKSCLNACQITTRTSMAGKGNPTSYPTRVSSYPTSAPTAFPTAYYPTNYPTAFPTNYPIASSTSPTDQPTKWDSTSDEENPDSNYACSFHLGPQPEGRCCDKEGMTIIPRIDRYNAWHEPLRWDAFDAEDASANFFIILLASFMVLTCGVGPHIIADLIAKCCTWDRVKTLSEWTPGSISSNDLIYTKAQFRLERKVWDLSLDPLESLVDDHIDAEELSLLCVQPPIFSVDPYSCCTALSLSLRTFTHISHPPPPPCRPPSPFSLFRAATTSRSSAHLGSRRFKQRTTCA